MRYQDDVSALYSSMQRLVGAGVSSDQIRLGGSLSDIIETLAPDDRLVVCTLHDLATGLPSLLRQLAIISSRGATLESLDEPWFDMRSMPVDWASFFDGLTRFGTSAVAARTRMALSDAAHAGRKLGRPVGSISAVHVEKYRRGVEMYRRGVCVAVITRELGLSRSNFVRWLDRNYPDLRKQHCNRKRRDEQ